MMIDIEKKYFQELIKNANTSYKLFLLMYIVESVTFKRLSFKFKELSCGMVSKAWPYFEKKYQRFNKNDKIFDLVEYILINYQFFNIYTETKEIEKFLAETEDKEILKMLDKLVLYVPYRLIITNELNNQLRGIFDSRKNDIIERYSQNNELFYTIKGKHIFVNVEYIKSVIICKEELLSWADSVIKKRYLKNDLL